MDGLEAVARIMASCATPILVLTADGSAPSTQLAFDALSRGALELMVKPPLVGDGRAARALCERLQLLASVPVVHHPRRVSARPVSLSLPPPRTERVVALVASTGGPPALLALLEALPGDFPLPILIVQHLCRGFARQFADWLDHDIALRVSLATRGDRLEPGHVYVAPDDFQMEVSSGHIRLVGAAQDSLHCPSGDALLHSVARVAGRGSIGVVLTGLGKDGAAGLLALRKAGGITIAQDESTSIVDGMPGEARKHGAALEVLPLDAIPARLMGLAMAPAGPKRDLAR
jgi:two-component system chemotaxis response regulator CheB